jgi:formamidopyrimidine-DNA glycosylase
MPELPEVETIVTQLRARILNRKISEVVIRTPAILKSPRSLFEKKLPGKKVDKISRRGKFIRIDLEGENTLWFHLGMTGQLLWREDLQALDKHAHLILSFEASCERLIFRDIRKFGGVAISNGNPELLPTSVRLLGPEPFEIQQDDFAALLKKRTGIIKSLLLNQRLLAGLGNIYADESLFRAGINPRKRAIRLTQLELERLYKAIRETLREAIASGGSSLSDYIHINGESGKFQNKHQVYGRFGKPCKKCEASIRRVRLAGRSSCFCPQCQK